MKYCISCGSKLIDEAVFCPKCGTKQSEENEIDSTIEQSSQPTAKPKKKKKLLAIIIAAVAVVLAAVIITVSLLIIPKSFAKNVEYSKGASERDSRFNMTFEQFLDRAGKAADDNYDYYKNIALQQIDYDTSSYKADFFEYMIGAYSGKEFKEKVCDKNNWSKDENGDYKYTFSVTSSNSNQPLRMSEVTLYMDDNKSEKITGILILFGNAEKEITQLQETAVEFISFVFTEAITGTDKETSVICPLLAFNNSIEIYVYNEVKFQTTPTTETVNMVTIEALSEKAKNEGNLSKQEEMGIVTYLTDNDVEKAKTQLLSGQEQTKTIPSETQPSTTQSVTHKDSQIVKTDNELGYEFDLSVDSFSKELKNSADNKLCISLKVSDYKLIKFDDEKEKLGNKFNIDYRGYQFDDFYVLVDNDTDHVFQITISGSGSISASQNLIFAVIGTINPSYLRGEVDNCYQQITESKTSYTSNDGSVTIKYYFNENVCYEYQKLANGFSFVVTSSSQDNYNKYLKTVSSNMKKSNNDTTESSNDNNLDYIVEDFGDFYADVPKNWVYEVENGGIYFYEAYNHSHEETGSTGYLCDIKGVSPENKSEISQNSEYLGSSGTIEYYVEFPMGIGMIEDETASDKMQTAHSQVEDFVESIILK